MSVLGNLLWFILGGLITGLAWWLVGLLFFLSIIGIPWGRAAFVMGHFAFIPFGKEAISRDILKQEKDIGTGVAGMVGNVLWFVFAGVWVALAHLLFALVCFLTIIGIPFGLQHLKLAGIAIFPIGKTIVSKEVAEVAKKAHAEKSVNDMRG